MASLTQIKMIRNYGQLEKLIDFSLVKKLKKIKYVNSEIDIEEEIIKYDTFSLLKKCESSGFIKISKSGKLIKVVIDNKKPIFLNVIDLIRINEDSTKVSAILKYCHLRNIRIRELKDSQDLYEEYIENISNIKIALQNKSLKKKSGLNESSLLVLKSLNEKAASSITYSQDKRFFCSIRYISNMTKLSKSTVQRSIKTLIELNYLNSLSSEDTKDLRELESYVSDRKNRNNFNFNPTSVFEVNKFSI